MSSTPVLGHVSSCRPQRRRRSLFNCIPEFCTPIHSSGSAELAITSDVFRHRRRSAGAASLLGAGFMSSADQKAGQVKQSAFQDNLAHSSESKRPEGVNPETNANGLSDQQASCLTCFH